MLFLTLTKKKSEFVMILSSTDQLSRIATLHHFPWLSNSTTHKHLTHTISRE